MRLFAAIPVEGDARAAMAEMAEGFRCGRMVPEHQFHITLAYFGDAVPQQQAEELAVLLGGITADPFLWSLAGLGQFGSRKPYNLHAVVKGNGLRALAQDVTAAGRSAGLRLPGRKFAPHITISRLKAPLDRNAAELFEARLTKKAGPFQADRFDLFESRLLPDGPEYASLVTYPLGPEWNADEWEE